MLDDTKYVMYGISLEMKNIILSSIVLLKSQSLLDVLDIIDKSSLTQTEKNIVIFEIGRIFERGK